MLPVITPDEMRAIDSAAPEPVEVLVERAGAAVASAAVAMMGGTYGRTVVVVAGKGNNGADGRVAAVRLASRGVRVRMIDAADPPPSVGPAHLVIDAAYGTGFRGVWPAPEVLGAPVLAVDVPSGVDALTGEIAGPVMAATRTVTFAALKPGLLLHPGRGVAGQVDVAGIGLDVTRARAHLVQASDVAEWWPARDPDAHKWRAAVRVVAGSPSMTGAAALVARAALRSGAGMVHLSVPGQLALDAPVEVVQRTLPGRGWAGAALATLDRFRSVVVGPGLGRDDATAEEARTFALDAPLPVVVDGDGLFALAWNAAGAAPLLRRRTAPTVLTPHDGEYALLTGAPPGADRCVAARRLAHDTGAVVLLKGPTTVVAEPSGQVLLITTGDARLATAGTGDVLSGIVGALLAQGLPAFEAAAAAAWVHGAAGRRCAPVGAVAGDLPDRIPEVVGELVGPE